MNEPICDPVDAIRSTAEVVLGGPAVSRKHGKEMLDTLLVDYGYVLAPAQPTAKWVTLTESYRAENEAIRNEVKRRDDALAESAERNRLMIAENAALRAALAEARDAMDSVSAEPDLSLTDRLAIRAALTRIDALTAAMSAQQGDGEA